MVLLWHPPLSLIQNKDNGSIVLLVPPRPWQRRKCFAVVAVNSISSNGPTPVANDKRTRGEGADSSYMPFAPLLMMNCVICRRASAPSPLAPGDGGGALQRRHSSPFITGVKARGEQ